MRRDSVAATNGSSKANRDPQSHAFPPDHLDRPPGFALTRWRTLIWRELLEYRVSLIWTPFLIAAVLIVVLGAGQLVLREVGVLDRIYEQIAESEGKDDGLRIRIDIGDDGEEEHAPPILGPLTPPGPAAPPSLPDLSELPGLPEASDPPGPPDASDPPDAAWEDWQEAFDERSTGASEPDPMPEPDAPEPETPEPETPEPDALEEIAESEPGPSRGLPASVEITVLSSDPDLEADDIMTDAWNFDRDWSFEPWGGATREKAKDQDWYNPDYPLVKVPLILHTLMLVILFVATANYLLGCLYGDRKDRSQLFWKSMPVSEAAEISAKLVVALVVAPLCYLLASFLLQGVLLGLFVHWSDAAWAAGLSGKMGLGWAMAYEFAAWWTAALWILPVYAWMLLCSAWARRSPFLLAITPVFAIVVVEELAFGTSAFGAAVSNHMPYFFDGGQGAGFTTKGPNWSELSLSSLLAGLAAAAVLLWLVCKARVMRLDTASSR